MERAKKLFARRDGAPREAKRERDRNVGDSGGRREPVPHDEGAERRGKKSSDAKE